ncbi:MAG: 2-octaprenyl-6-methoxyphenyl hydroxylase [Legionella sp.]|nr:2-octaprenyl-6-methoxyphenyl hydroxylase [Legionella sp.]
MDKQVDILIIGGGLTGATLMLALQALGYDTVLVETRPFGNQINSDFDARSLALSPASKRILNMLGVWAALEEFITPINHIHVSDKAKFGVARLQGEVNNPLGFVIEMQHLNRAIHNQLDQNQLIAPATLTSLDLAEHYAKLTTNDGELTIKAQLIVAADGAESVARTWSQLPAKTRHYEQQAIVANIGLAKPHQNRAFERFTPHGPLALLPMQGKRMSLVWAVPPQRARELTSVSDEQFLKELQNEFGYRLGRFSKAGKRFTYPLKQVLMPRPIKWPIVFIGNAAHTLHPVAGQGFNLGLRDVATLAQCIAKHGLKPSMLDSYIQLRQHDQYIITQLTDGLINLFTSTIPGISLMRSIGLVALDNSALLKNTLARYTQGFGGVIPDLVCEIALDNGRVHD